MRTIHSLEEAAATVDASVVAVGNFDGIHRAHTQILAAVRAEARTRGCAAIAVTFTPHPSRILRPAAAPPLITPGEQQLRLLAAAGLDATLQLPFSRDLSLWTPREFAVRVLVDALRARAVHEGEGFRFGRRQEGDAATLAALGRELGFAVHLHPAVRVAGEPVSSSRIRACVARGDMGRARRLLGRPFEVHGLVAPGLGVGRQRTVPTLNLQHYEELLPGRGVYLTCARLDRSEGEGNRPWLPALTNVGVRPTFGAGGALTVETHLLSPPPDLSTSSPGAGLALRFLRFVREERRFDSPEALKSQIESDRSLAQRYFARLRELATAPGANTLG
jgi:riboflavin kinase/FMN adenylyltransferase